MRKTAFAGRWRIAKIAFVFAVLSLAIPALAYSGTGEGSAINPYKVATCSQLQAIQDDLDAYYKQTGDIDCAESTTWNGGSGFVPLGTGAFFTGTYNGQGFKIKNLHITPSSDVNAALFGMTNGATLTNIHLDGGEVVADASSGLYNGTLVGSAYASNISNCSSTAAISGQWGGGLIGVTNGGTVVSECWYGGTTALNGYRYTGGMFGLTMDSTISNIYSKGTFEARGGIAGVIGTGTSLANAYSIANVTYNDTDAAGGLFGSIDGVISATAASNIFFDGTITATSSSAKGGAIGSREDGATVSGVHYNASGCNCSTGIAATPGGSGTATAVNIGNADPDYFQSNSTNSPMSSWNFLATWQTNTGSYLYPTLRSAAAPADGDNDGIANTIESAAPNSGDANNDGVADDAQTNVASFVNPVTGTYAGLAATCDRISSVNIAAETANMVEDTVFNYPFGLTDFTLACNTPGQTATITIYYYYTANTGAVAARKYNSAAQTYQAIPGATITDTTVGGQKVLMATYQITDGGNLDEDGTANGTIVDPAGLAISNIIVPNTGFGGGAQR